MCVIARKTLRLLGGIVAFGLGFKAAATNHILRQDEIMAGLGGDPRVQFVEITVSDGTQKVWGPPFPGQQSRAMLVFFNGAGLEVGRFFFPANAPVGGNTVLIATENFAALPGAPVPDFIMPPLMSPGSGKVCFKGNPASPGAFDVNLCISYGNFPATQTEGAGLPAPALAITGDPVSLTRFRDFSFGQSTSQNADFALASPTPLNTRGQTMIFPVDGPEIHTIPTSLDFGSRNINQGPTAAQTLIITNRGIVNALTITNVALNGTNATNFNIIADTGQTILAPGGTRTVTLNFDPSTGGRKTASLRIICNDTNEVITDVPLQGTGVDPSAPEINVTPLLVDFGNQDVTATPVPRPVTISNQGQVGSLNVSNIFLTGDADQFQITSPTNASTLGPAAIRILAPAFHPTSPGPKSARIRIISDDTDEGATDVVLQGRAFDLNPCTAPNPSNSVPQNLCGNAQLVCPGTIFTGTLTGASRDGNATCGPQQSPDVWCRYIPASDGTLVATLIARGSVQAISAHSSCPGTPANELACAAVPVQVSTNTSDPRITVPVTNGIPVLIRLAGVSDAVGVAPFQLMLSGPACVEFDRNNNGRTDACEFDFGDAFAPYPTKLIANGARHRAFTGVFLGDRIDPEDDGQPTALANGDNLDGEINDDDGITLTAPLIVGQRVTLSAKASAAGFLNAWIDFNADGDWADAGEQIFTDRALTAGTNNLAFDVPANAVVTNLTFARYRFSSSMGLSFVGAAEDGEVEDYVVEILSATPTPGNLAVRISEVMAGLNGDSTIQFVELEANGDANKAWGPQGSETAGRAMLLFFDGAGVQSGRFVFSSNAPAGQNTVLVATRAFAEATGIQPDFIMAQEIVPIGGKVAFASNPDNKHFDINIALSYGGTEYFGMTDGAGPANGHVLPIMHARSLAPERQVPFGLNENGAFQLTLAPTPRNTRGQTATLAVAPIPEQGRTLFLRERFRGNGRTCGTCHVPGRDQFGLTPATIDELPESDPLFVFEDNVNTLRLFAPSWPSDLRGLITGMTGSAWVLSGSGGTYLVLGGANLTGNIADANGNGGSFESFAAGDLNGPTPSNGSSRGLEDHTLLTHGRGLILENIDGFKAREVFRASPHLLALAHTAPFGLSGEFDSLDDFSDGAVVQHFPKSLARVSGVDFRHPTREELGAMSEFMFGISNLSTNALNLDRLATTEAQKRGRALFFGDEGRCSKCHSGPVLAFSDGSLSGSVSNKNENFNTGVANQPINLPIGHNLPTEPAGLEPGHSTREFNTPGLFGIRLTAPFFHDGSALTLEEAVKFYDSEEFHNSPAGVEVGSLLAANKAEMVPDLVAFLESLVELPVDFPREITFGIRCPGQPLPSPRFAAVTNLGATTITITNVFLNGPNSNELQILSDSGEVNLAPGQTRRFQIAFAPTVLGVKRATLEFGALDTNLLGGFSFAVGLTAADVDNLVTSSPLSFDFGTRDIDAPPSPEESIVVTNDGSIALDVAIDVVGTNPADFMMVTETNAIPAHGTRVIQVAFAPKTAGTKSAMVRIRMVSCTGTLIEIPLAGVASSTVHHFAWNSIVATQFVGTAFPVGITAQDRNNETVQNFRGTVRLMSVIGTQTNTILIAPTNSSPFVNGVWNGSITVQQPTASLQLLARDNQNHTGLSGQFAAPLRDDLVLTVSDAPDPVTGGQQMAYTLTVHNTGPGDATGVVITDQLSPDVRFITGSASQGTVSHASGVVTASLGSLGRAANVSVSIIVEPNPPAAALIVTNVASASRTEPEVNLANNTVTNTTRIEPFGVLSVTPLANFSSTGFTGGPFTPTNQIYTLSNVGTAPLGWQARSSGCAAPAGLVGWWPLDGNGADKIGTNTGTLTGSPLVTNGLVAQALLFDGNDDTVRVPPSPSLNVGLASGMTVEAWINPSVISVQRPVVEWNSGVHLWISVVSGAGGGPGSIFANVVGVNGPTSHHVSSAPNLVLSNVWQHIALTYTKATGIATLYLNGTVVARTNFGSFTPLTSNDLLLGARNGVPPFLGMIDEVGIYDRDLTDAEIGAIFVSGAAGKCGTGTFNCAPGIVALWPLEGDAMDSINTNTGVLGGPLFTNGFVGQGLLFDGNDSVRFPASPTLNVGAGVGLTMEAWINAASIAQQQPIVEWVGPADIGVQLWISVALPGGGPGCLFANIVEGTAPAGPFTNHRFVSPPNLIAPNVWQHVALTYDTNTGLAVLYANGVVAAQENIGTFSPVTSVDAFIGRATFAGIIDEVAIYDRALTPAEVRSIFTAGAFPKCGTRGPLNCVPGMVSWWTADGTTNDVADSNHGRLVNGASFGTGFVGGRAFAFDGVNDKVELGDPDNLKFTNAFTIEAWVFANGFPNGPGPLGQIFFRGDPRGCLDPYAFAMQRDGTLLLHVEGDTLTPSCGANVITPTPLPTNEWVHVAGVFNEGNMRIYIDGVQVAEANTPVRPFRDLAAGGSVAIGNHSSGFSDQCFNGLIDELAVYNRALSQSEIQFIFGTGVVGKCRQGSWLTLSAFSGALLPGSNTTVALMINTNANRLDVGSYSQTILFTNVTHARGSSGRLATLDVFGGSFALRGPPGLQMLEDSTGQLVPFTIISRGTIPALTITASSSNPELIVNPIPVQYVTGSGTGTFTLTLVTNANGGGTISLVAQSSTDAATNSFLVTVLPVNDAPTLTAVGDMSVDEGMMLLLPNIANDVDLSDDQLTLSLPGAPAGWVIESDSGSLSWAPDESQGPGVYPITVIVRDNGVPFLSATNQFTVTVREVNRAPTLMPLRDFVVHAGTRVAFNTAATDPDIPANPMSYLLGPNAPAGATMTPGGAFSWTASGPGTNVIRLIVRDAGTPVMEGTDQFTVIVRDVPLIQSIMRTGDTVSLRWTAIPGTAYRVQTKTALTDSEWTDIPNDITATGDSASATDALDASAQRFYKIRVVP